MIDKSNFVFPFAATSGGRTRPASGDEAIRAKIIQVLFTSPGERPHQPQFGCGLLNLVFDGSRSQSDELKLQTFLHYLPTSRRRRGDDAPLQAAGSLGSTARSV